MHLSKPWLVIVNPRAGNGTVERLWPKVEPELLALLPQAEIRISQSIADVQEMLNDALNKGLRHVMAVGGDGSAHQLVNAIMCQDIVATREITFSLLPLGTGNDWIKTHGVSKEWSVWKDQFIHSKERFQNVGEINCYKENQPQKKYFINVAGLAYDGFVVKYAEGQRSILPGKLYYLWLSLSCLFRYATQKATFKYDSKVVQQRFYTINVGIGRFSGGGMQFVPHAQPDADTFALTYVGHLSRLSVLLNSFRFYKGRVANFKKATLSQAKIIEIKENNNSPIFIEADGEYLGQSPISIALLPRVLKFIPSK